MTDLTAGPQTTAEAERLADQILKHQRDEALKEVTFQKECAQRALDTIEKAEQSIARLMEQRNDAIAYAERLENALQVFADLGRSLQAVAEFPGYGGGRVAAGLAARSSVSWGDFELAAKAMYGAGVVGVKK